CQSYDNSGYGLF
nr:immunoglobulin light chain junction region [Macaca mulatta]